MFNSKKRSRETSEETDSSDDHGNGTETEKCNESRVCETLSKLVKNFDADADCAHRASRSVHTLRKDLIPLRELCAFDIILKIYITQ